MTERRKKINPTGNSLSFITNYIEEKVPVHSIKLIHTEKKITEICLTDGTVKQTYMSLSELKKQLPSDRFFQINRKCILAFSAVKSYDRKSVELIDGHHTDISSRRYNDFVQLYAEYVKRFSERKQNRDFPDSPEAFSSYFRILNDFPNPIFIVEMVLSGKGEPIDYVFRYINFQFLDIGEKRYGINDIIGHSFFELYVNGDPAWIDLIADIALHGVPYFGYFYSKFYERRFFVKSYQPLYGFCCVSLLEEGKIQLSGKQL
ncbi:MAG: LytTR family transcriptional regulator [Lachnospiraceae bacterium]|nr:LytTR family transcriptional regulator [Lachnospiraceae bacterium]